LTVTAVCSNIVLISNGRTTDEPATCDCTTAALVIGLRTAEDAAEEMADVIERLLDTADDSAEDISTDITELLETAAAVTVVELSIDDMATDDIAAEDIADGMSVEETAATDAATVVSAAIEEAGVIIVDIGDKLIVV
jgi:hypothetical protein